MPSLLFVCLDSGWPSRAPHSAQVVLGLSAVGLAADPAHRRSAVLGATVVTLGFSGMLGLGEVFGGGYWNQVGVDREVVGGGHPAGRTDASTPPAFLAADRPTPPRRPRPR